MFGIIVGTHGIFSSELVKSCEMICGKKDYIKSVTFVQGESVDNIAAKYQNAIAELGNPAVAVLIMRRVSWLKKIIIMELLPA